MSTLEAGGSPVTVGVGAVVFPQDGATSEELLAGASTALAEAKRRGRGSIVARGGSYEQVATASHTEAATSSAFFEASTTRHLSGSASASTRKPVAHSLVERRVERFVRLEARHLLRRPAVPPRQASVRR